MFILSYLRIIIIIFFHFMIENQKIVQKAHKIVLSRGHK